MLEANAGPGATRGWLAAADADLCGVKVPRGTVLAIPIAMLHHDEEVWGADNNWFNPLRFRDGGRQVAAREP